MFDQDDNDFGLWQAQCQACDRWAMVNDLGLCEACDAKIQRDLIRARQWDDVAAAFGLNDESRELLRSEVIRQYGAANEMIADEPVARQTRR